MIITVFICCSAHTLGSSLATPCHIVCRLCAGLPQADVHVLSCGLLLFCFINCYSLTYQSRLRRRLFLFVDAFACFNVCLGLVSCFGRCPLVAFLSLQGWSLACLRVHAPFIVGPPIATLNRFPAARPRG